MAEVEAPKLPSLAEHYLVENKELKPEAASESSDGVEPSSDATSDKIVENIEETSAAVVREDEVAPPPAEEEESKESGPSDETTEDNSDQEGSDKSAELGNSDEQEAEETPEIKLETAPADFRFPTTNQTRHCFTRYIEYHRCVAAKGDGAAECDKFAKFYRSLCPGEWIDRWNEQRENGTFPGPL